MDGIYHNTEFEPEARAPTSPHCTITARRKDSKQLHRFISYRYHSLEQRRSSERSRRTAASTKRDHRVRNGNTPNRAGISAPSPSGPSPASTHATPQTNNQAQIPIGQIVARTIPPAGSDQARRHRGRRGGSAGAIAAAAAALLPSAAAKGGRRTWRRSCRRASPRRDRRRRRRGSGWG